MAAIVARDLKGRPLAALESIRVVLMKFGDLWIDSGLTVALVGVIAEVILMVRLRQVKHREGGDLSHDGFFLRLRKIGVIFIALISFVLC